MAEWSVRIEARAGADVTQDQALDVLEALEPYFACVSGGRGPEVGAQMWLEAANLVAALRIGLGVFASALKKTGIIAFQVIDVELMPWCEFEWTVET